MFFIMHIVFGLAYLFDRTKQNSNRSIELKNTILDYKRSLFNRSQFHHYYLQLLLALSGYFFFAYSMMSFIEDVFHGDKLLRSFSFWILLVGKIYLAFKVCDLLSLTKGTRKRISMLPIGIIITEPFVLLFRFNDELLRKPIKSLFANGILSLLNNTVVQTILLLILGIISFYLVKPKFQFESYEHNRLLNLFILLAIPFFITSLYLSMESDPRFGADVTLRFSPLQTAYILKELFLVFFFSFFFFLYHHSIVSLIKLRNSDGQKIVNNYSGKISGFASFTIKRAILDKYNLQYTSEFILLENTEFPVYYPSTSSLLYPTKFSLKPHDSVEIIGYETEYKNLTEGVSLRFIYPFVLKHKKKSLLDQFF